MKAAVSNKKQIAGLLYGLAAGLAFAFFAWGIDGILLAFAHGNFAWVKFVPGLVICLVSGGLVGWLTMKIEKPLVGIFLWIAQALLFSQLILRLPLQVSPAIIRIFNPALGDFLKYPFYPDLNQNLWFGFAIIAAVSIVCALLESILIDQALFSEGKFALAVPLAVCMLAFSLVGNSADSLLNKHVRDPIVIVDNLIDFAIANKDKEVPTITARAMHLAALAPVKDKITVNRKLILSNFDSMLGQVDVLVDFEGQWVKCTTIYKQVTNCTKVFEQPWIRFSTIREVAQNALPAIRF